MDYLLINIGSIGIPLVYSFHPKLQFYKKWRSFSVAILLTLIPFVIWDILFTKLGVWGFSEQYLIGINLFNLPLEEVLFFVCIPYSCLFTYHCITLFLKPGKMDILNKILSPVLIILSAILSILANDLYYTFYTFSSLLFVLIVLRFILKVKWLGTFLFTYLIILIPFFIVNGLLTGTGYDTPIVWYNNLENLSTRIGTIPVEDIFYGLLLLLLNVTIYEFHRKRITVR